MSETTLRDNLEAAFEEHDEPIAPVETPVEEVSTEVQEGRARDEQGRFAPKAQEPAPIEQHAPVDQPQIKPRPSSWKKEYEEHWSKFDPNVQDYILQREADYAKGVSTYKSQWDSAAPIVEAINQFMPDLERHNINPAQWINNLGLAHKTLAEGSAEQKLQMFAKLATDYGVPLQALTGQQADPQFSQLAQELSQLKNQWGQFQTQQQQMEQAQLRNEIDTFKEGAEFFDDVRDTMAQLLESGLARNLQEAYDKAIRFNDDIWQKYQAKQAPATPNPVQIAAQKKAKAVSTRSAAPTGSMNNGDGKKDLRSLLSEQLDAAMGGRI